ncbi:hypothetical protein SPI_06439 [Niveomyces insectorum RCEF 264]|uniref:Uncharacterized protein n=1 Tax=Niveomyces insectorum RCEF 264 TaxID=1081102 RepID=A0A167R8I7_9HYPO|nr:hypothetical protein SPI_06439 [Niveomyces insectorum RCEF 264]
MGKPSKEARRKRRKEDRQRSVSDSVPVPGPRPALAAANTLSAPIAITSGTPIIPFTQRHAADEFTGAVSLTVARRRYAGGSAPTPGPLPSLSTAATPSTPMTTTPAVLVTPSLRRYVSIVPIGPSSPTAARLRAIAGTPPTRTPPSIGSRDLLYARVSGQNHGTARLKPATRPAVAAPEGDNRDDIVDEDIYRASDINANDGGSNDDSGRDADGNEDNDVGGGEDNND